MDKNERRKEISDFARKLSELAESAPDGYARRDLNRTLHFLRQRYKTSPEEKKILILKKISEGARARAELISELGFSVRQTDRSLKELIEEKKIRLEKIHLHDGGGRPRFEYFLTIEICFLPLENNSSGK